MCVGYQDSCLADMLGVIHGQGLEWAGLNFENSEFAKSFQSTLNLLEGRKSFLIAHPFHSHGKRAI